DGPDFSDFGVAMFKEDNFRSKLEIKMRIFSISTSSFVVNVKNSFRVDVHAVRLAAKKRSFSDVVPESLFINYAVKSSWRPPKKLCCCFKGEPGAIVLDILLVEVELLRVAFQTGVDPLANSSVLRIVAREHPALAQPGNQLPAPRTAG